MDRLEKKMTRTNNKLANYLEKSSPTCLYWTMAIEAGMLLLFFMM
jgi:hypothetical protein